MRIDLRELENFHGAPNAQRVRQPRHHITAASRSNHESMCSCGSTFADRPTALKHVVKSWYRGTCRTDRSLMTWSLVEVTQPISCNFCTAEFGLTQSPPAPNIRGSRHAQRLRQPRHSRQHTRYGHERDPGVHQEGRRGRHGLGGNPILLQFYEPKIVGDKTVIDISEHVSAHHELYSTEESQIPEIEDKFSLSYNQSLLSSAQDSMESLTTPQEADLDDEQIRILLALPRYLPELEASAERSQFYHSGREGLMSSSSQSLNFFGTGTCCMALTSKRNGTRRLF